MASWTLKPRMNACTKSAARCSAPELSITSPVAPDGPAAAAAAARAALSVLISTLRVLRFMRMSSRIILVTGSYISSQDSFSGAILCCGTFTRLNSTFASAPSPPSAAAGAYRRRLPSSAAAAAAAGCTTACSGRALSFLVTFGILRARSGGRRPPPPRLHATRDAASRR